MADPHSIGRRSFLKGSGGGALTLASAPALLAQPASEQLRRRAGDGVALGLIGVGSAAVTTI